MGSVSMLRQGRRLRRAHPDTATHTLARAVAPASVSGEWDAAGCASSCVKFVLGGLVAGKGMDEAVRVRGGELVGQASLLVWREAVGCRVVGAHLGCELCLGAAVECASQHEPELVWGRRGRRFP